MNQAARIRELEMEVESYRYAAERVADELVSILRPFRDGDTLGTALAVARIAKAHPDPRVGKEVH